MSEGDVYVNIQYNCDDTMLRECVDFINTNYSEVHSVKSHLQPRYNNRKEGVTLNEIYEYSRDHPEAKILYIHTKGIIRPFKCDTYFPSNDAKPWVYNWRNCMQRHLISGYRQCIQDLDDHDLVGVKWKATPVPHFSGNFWWANASYINTLESPIIQTRYWRWGRFSCEFWICGNRVDQIQGRPRNKTPIIGNPTCKKIPYSISRNGPTL